MNYTIQEIEDAILSELRNINYLKTLESYQGSLEDILENPEQMIVRFPAVLVVFGGSRYYNEGYPVYVYRQNMRFQIVIASGCLRSEQERRLGNEGTYQMLLDVRRYLAGKQLDLEISPLGITDEQAIFNGKIKGRLISIYAATYETDIDFACVPE